MKETKDSSQRLNKAEKSWILYDVANSAFIMIVTATIPIYFRSLAEGSGMSGTSATSLWGSATSISILILALLSPVLGAIADYENMKKKIFTIFFVIAIAGGFLFTFAPGWLSFLIFLSYPGSAMRRLQHFYDAMLIDVTTDERMDRVSTCGYAFGYIGSCIPFVAGLLPDLKLRYHRSSYGYGNADFLRHHDGMVDHYVDSAVQKMCTSNIPCLMSPMFLLLPLNASVQPFKSWQKTSGCCSLS